MDKLTYMYEYPIEIALNFYSSIVVIIVELMGIKNLFRTIIPSWRRLPFSSNNKTWWPFVMWRKWWVVFSPSGRTTSRRPTVSPTSSTVGAARMTTFMLVFVPSASSLNSYQASWAGMWHSGTRSSHQQITYTSGYSRQVIFYGREVYRQAGPLWIIFKSYGRMLTFSVSYKISLKPNENIKTNVKKLLRKLFVIVYAIFLKCHILSA